jgi:hypothetical protein
MIADHILKPLSLDLSSGTRSPVVAAAPEIRPPRSFGVFLSRFGYARFRSGKLVISTIRIANEGRPTGLVDD